MGNRSSSHYPPPPHWMHAQYGPGPGPRQQYPSNSPFPETKRPIAPGAFAEPYIAHNGAGSGGAANMRRSMISLNADSGYAASPADSDRLRMRGSRMSLNQMDFEHMHHHHPPPPHPRLIMPPDAKTLKKLEKMEKKQQKLLKKLGARGIPLPAPLGPPPMMHPMYTRAMSFDDLNRMHEVDMEVRGMRGRDWRQPMDNRQRMDVRKESHLLKHNFSNSSRQTREMGGSLASSSPMTSSEEGGHSSSDPWNNSSISSGRNGKRDAISPPMYSSTPHQQFVSSTPPKTQNIAKTIEVKVERKETVERTNEKPDLQRKSSNTNSNVTYAQPIIRGQHANRGSLSSVATSQMRCDQSEIDFSWVNEEEDKLRRETRQKVASHRDSRLPEFYFGMDPPLTEEKENEKSAHRRSTVLEKTAAFEAEVRRDKRDSTYLSRSTHHLAEPSPDYSPLQVHTRESGPAERRIYRMQRQADPRDDKRYRSSIAF